MVTRGDKGSTSQCPEAILTILLLDRARIFPASSFAGQISSSEPAKSASFVSLPGNCLGPISRFSFDSVGKHALPPPFLALPLYLAGIPEFRRNFRALTPQENGLSWRGHCLLFCITLIGFLDRILRSRVRKTGSLLLRGNWIPRDTLREIRAARVTAAGCTRCARLVSGGLFRAVARRVTI